MLEPGKLNDIADALSRASRSTGSPQLAARCRTLVDELHRAVERPRFARAEPTLATIRNMYAAHDTGIPWSRLRCYSPATGESLSAYPQDYIALSDDEPVCDRNGEPMILARPRTTYHDAVTGEMIR